MGAVRQGEGRCVRRGQACGGGRGGVVPRQQDASAMGKSTHVSLSVVQAHEDRVRMGADARGQVLAIQI
jgi:hypothetical protein